MLQKACLLFLLVVTVECVRNARQDAGTLRKQSGLRAWKRTFRGDVFENLFNVYDPSFLSGVWPKITNGMHLTLETSCWDDTSVFFKDLSEGRAWAYDAVDASGRYQSALFSGSRFWLGSKEECLRLDNNFQQKADNETLALLRNNDQLSSVLRRQKYFDAEINKWRWIVQNDALIDRLVAVDHQPPFRMAYTILQVQLNITKITMLKSYDITLGVCLPQSCPHDDVESIINFSTMLNDNLKSNKTVPRIARIRSSRRIDGDFRIDSDAGAIFLITVTVLLATVATIATLVDFDLMKCVRYKKQSMSFDLPTYNNSETKFVDELKRKHSENNSVGGSESANPNLVQMNKIPRSLADPPIKLDVVNIERMSGSCNRCGKYKRQCPNNKQMDNLPACPRAKYSSSASLSTEDRRKKHFFCILLLCFSFSYCWKRIFNKNTANKDLSFIHLMRIVATLWIIFVHVSVMVGSISDNAGDEGDNLYNILATGTIAFDTLFFVSGLFSSHHFFYLKSRYSLEELVSFGGTCGQFMQFVCFVTNRVIRLLPSYAYAIMVSAVVARASRSRSALTLPDGDHRNCDLYWWRNLLYVTALYPAEEQCMQVSWYLTAETQLHALGAMACAACAACAAGVTGGVSEGSGGTSARARLVVLTAAAFVLAATAADVSGAYVESGMLYSNIYDMYSVTIARPWARVASYFVGGFAGWLIHAMHGRLKLTRVTSSLLWGTSASLGCAAVSLPLSAPAWLAAWLHLAWPCALLWPALASATLYAALFRRVLGGGGAALSRLCYSALLLHGAAARILLAGDAPLCSRASCLWMYFVGTTALTLLMSLLLSLLVEMPCCGLFRQLSDCAAT